MDLYKGDDEHSSTRLLELGYSRGSTNLIDYISKFDERKSDEVHEEERLGDEMKQSIYDALHSLIERNGDVIEYIKNNLDIIPITFSSFILCESSLAEQLFVYINGSITPEAIRVLAFMVCINDSTIEASLHSQLYQIVMKCIASECQEIIHAILKLIRMIIVCSHFGRIALFALGFFNMCLNHHLSFSIENIRYLSKTLLRYCILDPVMGIDGYASSGGSLRPRKEIINSISVISGDKSVFFKTSHFLKTGNTFEKNREIWHLLNALIHYSDVGTVYGAIGSFSVLSINVINGAEDCLKKTDLLNILKNTLTSEIPELIFISLNVLAALAFSCDHSILKRLFEIIPFSLDIGLHCLSDQDNRIRIMAARFLGNTLLSISCYSKHIAKVVLPQILQFSKEDDFFVRKENVWLLINVLSVSDRDTRLMLLTKELLDLFSDFLDGNELPLIEAILNLFSLLIEDLDEVFIIILCNHDIVNIINRINEGTIPQLVSLSTFIINQIETPD